MLGAVRRVGPSRVGSGGHLVSLFAYRFKLIGEPLVLLTDSNSDFNQEQGVPRRALQRAAGTGIGAPGL